MKKIFGYFRDFHANYFSSNLFVAFGFFVSLLVVFNYTLNFKGGFIDLLPLHIKTLVFFVLYSATYLGVLVIIWFFGKQKPNLGKKFWIKSIIGLMILSFDNSFYPFLEILRGKVHPQTIVFFFKLSANFTGLFTILVPLLVFHWLVDRKNKFGFYGLSLTKVDWKPYWIMLLALIPLVFAVSFLSDFASHYPVYKRSGGEGFSLFYQIGEIWAILLFEVFYITDFIYTELFFRGFLILGMASLLGKNAVLPMVAAYAVLHFGKPVGETISSVFGGYILGVIALYSKNIWGGVFLHCGIAGLMELFAFWQMSR